MRKEDDEKASSELFPQSRKFAGFMFAGYFRQEGKQTSEREKIGLPSGQRWLVDASWSMRASEAPPICLLRGGLENASLFLIFFLLFRDSTYFVR